MQDVKQESNDIWMPLAASLNLCAFSVFLLLASFALGIVGTVKYIGESLAGKSDA